MKNENKLVTSEPQLIVEQFNKKEIVKSLVYAMGRCDSNELNLEESAKDINIEFNKKLNLQEIKIAIRTGAMGKYGVNYKLTTQVVGSWIYKYIKEN